MTQTISSGSLSIIQTNDLSDAQQSSIAREVQNDIADGRREQIVGSVASGLGAEVGQLVAGNNLPLTFFAQAFGSAIGSTELPSSRA